MYNNNNITTITFT